MRLLVALVVWVAAVVCAVVLGSAVESAVGPGKTTSTALPGATPSTANFDASAVRPTDPQSLFRSANFPRALAAAKAHLGADAKLDNFALYPGYLSVTAVKGESEVDFYVDATGGVQVTTNSGNPVGDTIFPLAQIQPTMPSAMAHSISRRAHVRASQLHYMVVEVDPSTNQLRWLIYPQAEGRIVYFEAPGPAGPLQEQLATGGLQPVR